MLLLTKKSLSFLKRKAFKAFLFTRIKLHVIIAQAERSVLNENKKYSDNRTR